MLSVVLPDSGSDMRLLEGVYMWASNPKSSNANNHHIQKKVDVGWLIGDNSIQLFQGSIQLLLFVLQDDKGVVYSASTDRVRTLALIVLNFP